MALLSLEWNKIDFRDLTAHDKQAPNIMASYFQEYFSSAAHGSNALKFSRAYLAPTSHV
uniref:Uncharacterized protein LOC8281553 n=1 Tax=Rhizophora mucronata TaxID=61149 RepID=A0A2P2IL22_RHIMU